MSIPERKKYIADFENLGFGMFVHWGLYSQKGKGEWIQSFENEPQEEYNKLIDTFTAEDFDAEKLVLTAKNAGCRYIVFTTRHHDGFSLYDTCGLNDFDAPHSPAKRDLVKEYVDACRKYDIVPFFYHTTLDWYNKDFDNDFDAYLEYLRNSVEILCKNYGKIGGFWFDGNCSKLDADWKEDELYKIVRKYQPEAIIANNMGLDNMERTGNPEVDLVTFEQGRPTAMNREGMKKYIVAEMCETVNNHWGIAYNDFNYKSPANLIESLCNSRKVGANFLLNIGPEAQGRVNPYQRELFSLIGGWMDIFGEAVYNGRPYGATGIGQNFILKSEDKKHLYIFVYNPAVGGNIVVAGSYSGSYSFGNVADKISSVKWMDNGETLDFVQGGDMLSVNLTPSDYGTSYVVRVARAEICE